MSNADVIRRLKAHREVLGKPMAGGRANPDNETYYVLLDAQECIEELERWARSLEKTLAARGTNQHAPGSIGVAIGQTEYQNPAPAKNPFRYNGGR